MIDRISHKLWVKINDLTNFQNKNPETRIIYLSYNHYLKGLEKMVVDLGVKVAYETKDSL